MRIQRKSYEGIAWFFPYRTMPGWLGVVVWSLERMGFKKWPKSRFLIFDFGAKITNLNGNSRLLHEIWDLIKNFSQKIFPTIPIWIQIGIVKLQRAKSASKPNDNPMKGTWGDSLIFSLSNHVRLARCCCVKFQGNEVQKMAKFEILRFLFLISGGAKSKFWIGALPWGKGSRKVILGSRHGSSRMVCLGLWWGPRGPGTPL